MSTPDPISDQPTPPGATRPTEPPPRWVADEATQIVPVPLPADWIGWARPEKTNATGDPETEIAAWLTAPQPGRVEGLGTGEGDLAVDACRAGEPTGADLDGVAAAPAALGSRPVVTTSTKPDLFALLRGGPGPGAGS